MAKDPAMLFYTKDFLTGVAFLNMKERGQYITLICLQQQLGHMSLKQMEQDRHPKTLSQDSSALCPREAGGLTSCG